MQEKTKNIIGSIVFLVLILTIAIGGYIFTFKNDKHQTEKERTEIKKNENKKEEKKDFIYYENKRTVSESLGIIYKDVVINLDNVQAKAIKEEIKNENEELYNSVKKISETEIENKDEITDTDDVYSATIRDYENYEYKNYISLVVSDSLYECTKGVYDYINLKSYIFDTEKNERISNVDAFNLYDTSLSEIKDEIKDKLRNDQTTNDEGVENIKIDETLENLSNDNSYALYIDESGNLIIKYIVKTNNLNYNEIMVID